MRDGFASFAKKANLLSDSDDEEEEKDFLSSFKPSFMNPEFNH